MNSQAKITLAAGILIVAGLGAAGNRVDAQRGVPPRRPLPQGERIEARDGDIVTLEDDARVRFVRRRQVVVRLVFNSAERSLLLLVDYASPSAPDGRVDMRHSFSRVSGQWPLAERWEGRAVIEEYQSVGQPSQGMGLVLPQGLVQLLSPSADEFFKETSALAVLNFGASSGGIASGVDFDEAERRQIADLARNNAVSNATPVVRMPLAGSEAQVSVSLTAAPQARARVGDSIRTPQKIRDVRPSFPSGWIVGKGIDFVLVELSVGTDGVVTDVRILRSVPELDDAAVAAASKWRFAPELLDGRATTYSVTAPVIFGERR